MRDKRTISHSGRQRAANNSSSGVGQKQPRIYYGARLPFSAWFLATIHEPRREPTGQKFENKNEIVLTSGRMRNRSNQISLFRSVLCNFLRLPENFLNRVSVNENYRNVRTVKYRSMYLCTLVLWSIFKYISI